MINRFSIHNYVIFRLFISWASQGVVVNSVVQMMDSINIQWTHCPHIRREILIFIFSVLPCLLLLLLLLLLMRVPFTGSAFGWATAMGVVLVMVVIVAAGNISVDMSMLRINLIVTGQTINTWKYPISLHYPLPFTGWVWGIFHYKMFLLHLGVLVVKNLIVLYIDLKCFAFRKYE